MKRGIALLLAIASIILPGCGGGGGSASQPQSPTLSELYQPWFGTYSATWTSTSGATGTTNVVLSEGATNLPSGAAVEVVNAYVMNMPVSGIGLANIQSIPNSNVYNTGDTKITGITLSSAVASTGMVLHTTATDGILGGTLETGVNTVSDQTYQITLTKQ